MSARSRSAGEVNSIDAHGRRLNVQFNWRGDRYGHAICLVQGGANQLLLESIDDGESFWPPSPPLQNISNCVVRSDSQRGEVTLLVGAAGTSHWSMTVAPRDHVTSRKPLVFQPELVFDVACRVKEAPHWLGSSYRICTGQIAISEKQHLLRVPIDARSFVVVGENSKVMLETCVGELPIIRCQATATPTESPPETIRWKYAVRLCEDHSTS